MELRKCECGGDVRLDGWNNPSGLQIYLYRCIGCGAYVAWKDSIDKAIQAWNEGKVE